MHYQGSDLQVDLKLSDASEALETFVALGFLGLLLGRFCFGRLFLVF